jgi:hypothetical protein
MDKDDMMRVTMRSLRLVMLGATAVALLGGSAAATDLERCLAVDIENAGWARVESLRSSSGVELWIELGREMVLCGDDDDLEMVVATTTPQRDARWIDRDRLFLARNYRGGELEKAGYRVLARSGGAAVVEALSGSRESATRRPENPAGSQRRGLEPLRAGGVIARRSTNRPPSKLATVFDPDVAYLVAQVNADSWFDDVVTLASWNRYTHSSEINQARDWIVAAFAALPGLDVTTRSFLVASSTVSNVVAVSQGTTRPEDWIIVGAHYDSTSQNPLVAAPGAEDNASGCAGVLEVARILTASPPEATVLYLCYAGEEQGLYGSFYHSSDLLAAGDDAKVIAMINMDMIGYNQPATALDVELETGAIGVGLTTILEDAAAEFTSLVTETTTGFYCCSDHEPYLDRGMPAVLTIEADYGVYPDYHSTTDVPANLSLDMARQILRMNVAAVSHLAGAGSAVIFADNFETGDTSKWTVVVAKSLLNQVVVRPSTSDQRLASGEK